MTKKIDKESTTIRRNLLDAVQASTGSLADIVDTEIELPTPNIQQDNYYVQNLPSGIEFSTLKMAVLQAHAREGYSIIESSSSAGEDHASLHFRKEGAMRFIQMQYNQSGRKLLVASGKIETE